MMMKPRCSVVSRQALMGVFALLLLPALLLAAPQSRGNASTIGKAPTTSAPSAENAAYRLRILELAELYRSFEWTASEENVFHGTVPSGAPVHTPDVSFDADGWHPDGRVNRGMPYAWGGFSSIRDFEEGLKEGRYAGNIPESTQAPGSSLAVGLDCSGFVARAWDLPTKQSTRTLGALCYELAGCDELLPGDILNKVNGHVVLFKEWVDEEHTVMRVVEADRLRVKENDYPVAERVQRGFLPMRYKPLDARWVPLDFSSPDFSRDEGSGGNWKGDTDASFGELADLASPLADAAPGEWADYEMTDNFPGMPPVVRRKTMVAGIEGARVETQTSRVIDGKPLMTGRSSDRTVSVPDALVDFLAFEEPFEEIYVIAGSVESGRFEVAGREFPASRISAFLETSWTMHGVTRPVTVEIEAVVSDEVPLQGVIEAHFVTEIVWEEDEEGNVTVSQREQSFTLRSFGEAPTK
jgi:hypothetical protein